MTSVIRVKRRIDEDPAEALIVSCKRKKATENVESIFSFAGTIASKNEPVSQHIKEAIKKTQHLHSGNLKHPSRRPEITLELRRKKEEASRANRFRVTCSRRALDLDLLDNDDAGKNSEKEGDKDVDILKLNRKCLDSRESNHSCCAKKENEEKPECLSDKNSKTVLITNKKCEKNISCNAVVETSPLKEDKMFCILDVENDEAFLKETAKQSLSGITLNNTPMVSHKEPALVENEEGFVYDLYYARDSLNDLDLGAVLTVEALCDDLINEDFENFQDRDGCQDDSDDSNDENNWRNDYPDEDPHFFENEDVDDYYAEDMVDTNFLHHDDEQDQLAYWMGTRCHVDGKQLMNMMMRLMTAPIIQAINEYDDEADDCSNHSGN
ncbi:hypothetical protein Btru_011177 [Bulinus truncatus]|nr:hypothetical protein Btru_011177 [Bulinus truncatus]